MHREGHLGAALLASAPLGALVRALGFPAAAIGGGVAAVLVALGVGKELATLLPV